MHITEHKGRYFWSGEKRFLNFSTTAYLNLAYERQFQNWFVEGYKKFGLSYGSSPLTEPRLAIYEELEQELASTYQAEAAILFSTGFAASQAVMKFFDNKNYTVEYGPFHHPALQIRENKSNKFFFAGDIADPVHCRLFTLNELPNDKPTVIDASHGFGVLDQQIKEFVTQHAIVCGSLNKGLSTAAGLVLCTNQVKKQIVLQNRYTTSSAPPPASCYALLHAMRNDFINQQQEKLAELTALIPQRETYNFISPLPILKPKETSKELYESLLKEGVLIWHNQYPKNSGKKINRVVLHAGLRKRDVTKLLEVIENLS